MFVLKRKKSLLANARFFSCDDGPSFCVKLHGLERYLVHCSKSEPRPRHEAGASGSTSPRRSNDLDGIVVVVAAAVVAVVEGEVAALG